MEKVFAAGAMAFGAVTLALLTAMAMWLGDATAVKIMLGSTVLAYLCQWAAATAWLMPSGDGNKWLARSALTLMLGSWAFGAAAIWYMVA